MPARRLVHLGLILSVAVLSSCVMVLVMGSVRENTSNTGLPGAKAPAFNLREESGTPVSLEGLKGRIGVLIFAAQNSRTLADVAPGVHRMMGTFQGDANVRLLGISYVRDLSLLGPTSSGPSALDATCPGLAVAYDTDGSVARAFRIAGPPTVVVVDAGGTIRGRTTLDGPSSFVAINEIINSLRSSGIPMHNPLPVAPATGLP